MDIESFREYCLVKKGVTESFPFDDKVLVFKVASKVFALSNIYSEDFVVNLKCDPERAEELRMEFPDDIQPGYHMNKKHWNSIRFENNLNHHFLQDLIDHSYDLVVAKLTKREREQLLS